MDHLDESVEQPGMLELKEGTYTLGRSAPADLVIGVPTVSAKHAELKVGEQPPMRCPACALSCPTTWHQCDCAGPAVLLGDMAV